MRSVTLLILAFHVAMDHQRHARFRSRFLWTLAISGTAVATLGIFQRAGFTALMLAYMNPLEGQAFGPFNYHGNAGAFLLLCFPAAAVLAAGQLLRGKIRAGFLAGVLAGAILLGLCVCTSRAAAVLGILEAVGMAIAFWRIFSPAFFGAGRMRQRVIWGGAAAVLLAAALAVLCMPAKWRLLPVQVMGENGRFIVWRMGIGMARDAGFFGIGPGTFGELLPLTPHFDPALYSQAIVTYPVPGEQVSMWVHAHNDLLQAVVEWGWLGGVLWTLAAGMVIVQGVRAIGRSGRGGSGAGGGKSAVERAQNAAVLAAVLAVMTQSLVDFPFQVLALQMPAVMYAAFLFAAHGRRDGRGPAAGKLAVERVDGAARARSGAGAGGFSPVVRRRHRSADNTPAGRTPSERPWRDAGR